jgi:hypothetical protein
MPRGALCRWGLMRTDVAGNPVQLERTHPWIKGVEKVSSEFSLTIPVVHDVVHQHLLAEDLQHDHQR